MKRIVFPFLGIIMLVFSGCIDPGNGDNISSFSYVPAIVDEFDFTTSYPALFTSLGKVSAPELYRDLSSGKLYDGAAVLANFSINYDQQPSTEYTLVSDVELSPVINQTSAYSNSGGGSVSGNFNGKIVKISGHDLVFCDNYKAVIFIAFIHEAPEDQEFIYEMTYDAYENTDILYIRAKNDGQGTKTSSTFPYLYVFDISDYLTTLRGGEKKVTFNLKYKMDVDNEGRDIYGEYENPIEILYE